MTADIDLTELHEYLTVRLVKLGEMLNRAAAEAFETRFGIRNAELWILVELGRKEPLAVNELSRRTRIDKAWVSRSAGALMRRGLVHRTPHPRDSRVSLLSLTDKGESLLRQIAPVAKKRHERMLSGLDRTKIYETLDELSLRAEDLLQKPDG
jgi:DNA-binding MarR family transcriptional regulator